MAGRRGPLPMMPARAGKVLNYVPVTVSVDVSRVVYPIRVRPGTTGTARSPRTGTRRWVWWPSGVIPPRCAG